MATETKTFYPGAYDSSSNVTIANASNSVGKGSNNTSYATIKPKSLGTSGNVYWSFDTSAIPDDAEITAVSCKAKANVSSASSFTTANLQLYSGSTAKGSVVSFKVSSASAKEITAGAWTKPELESARLRLTLLGSTSASFYFYGADLTVQYTYQGQKFTLKLGGAWHDIARVFKRANGIWVEQEELANVVDQDKRLVNGGEHVARLPAGYTRLEYIEANGNQYINTGFNPKYNTRVVMEVSDVPNDTNYLFGARNQSSSTASLQFGFYRSSSAKIRVDYFGSNITANVSDSTSKTVVDMDGNVATAWGVTATATAVASGECPYPLFLFALNSAGSPTQYAVGKLHSCRIYDNGEQVRKLVPCTDMSGVVGMYDLVNDVFYPSATSTSFVAGPEFSGGSSGGDSGSSGGDSGSTPSNLISFTIDGTSYQAEEGMTWAEWCDSPYDTASEWAVKGNTVEYTPEGYVLWDRNSEEFIHPTEVIISGGSYSTV